MRLETRPLPQPTRERWQPLRSGFVNLYRYDREEFHYENGRLLLRGNNGTGKSRVLALKLPFLFDGEGIRKSFCDTHCFPTGLVLNQRPNTPAARTGK